MPERVLALEVVVLVFAASCGGTPKPPEAPKEAPKPLACHAVGPYAEPLLEEWRNKDRDQLDDAIKANKDGVAVVSYDCHGLHLVKGCTLPGAYSFAGFTRDEGSFEIRDPEEIEANLPLSGATLAREMKPGREIDVAYFSIGRYATVRTRATKADLRGTCDGATHFVRAAHFGAIATTLGPVPDHKMNTAEIFTAATGVASEDEFLGGSAEEPCRMSTSDATSPPPRCAMMKLELVGIGDDAAYDESAPPPDPCPEGLVRSGGKCSHDKSVPHRCAPKDLAECTSQCDKNDAMSCLLAGLGYKAGPKARSAIERAAEAGVPRANYELALMVAKTDKYAQKADLLMSKACSQGDAYDCWRQGAFFEAGELLEFRSPSRAYEAYKRGCNLASGPACAALAAMYLGGRGIPDDAAAAGEILTRTCGAGDPAGCGELGALYANGQGIARDANKAKVLLEQGCNDDTFVADACTALAGLYESGEGGVGKDRARAVALYEKSCKAKDVRACTHLCKMKDKAACKRVKELTR